MEIWTLLCGPNPSLITNRASITYVMAKWTLGIYHEKHGHIVSETKLASFLYHNCACTSKVHVHCTHEI